MVSRGDRGECGEGGMLRFDGLNGWGVIARLGILAVVVVAMLLLDGEKPSGVGRCT